MAMNGIPPIIPPLQGFDEFQRETELELAGAPRFRLTRFGTIKPDITAQYLVKGSVSLSSGERRNAESHFGHSTS
jgi:hypothetical protein